jgi:hypothetical protein
MLPLAVLLRNVGARLERLRTSSNGYGEREREKDPDGDGREHGEESGVKLGARWAAQGKWARENGVDTVKKAPQFMAWEQHQRATRQLMKWRRASVIPDCVKPPLYSALRCAGVSLYTQAALFQGK